MGFPKESQEGVLEESPKKYVEKPSEEFFLGILSGKFLKKYL